MLRCICLLCVLVPAETSKFLPIPSSQYDAKGGMSFNSRFSCSQSIRLDAMDWMVGARHKTLRHMRAQIISAFIQMEKIQNDAAKC